MGYTQPFAFLGTMAGNQSLLMGKDENPCYARTYEPFGGSEDLRKRISQMGEEKFGRGFKAIGDAYSFTPWWEGREFCTKQSGSLPGGGFFLTVREFEDDSERHLNCFKYALGTFGAELEKLAGKEMREIQQSASNTIDPIVESYFTSVTEPEDGDLVVYSVSLGKKVFTPHGNPVTGTTHAGVYRKSRQNWNSPQGGTIESKWGWFGNPYVFQHDVFFVPDFYGDTVKFYRLKNST